MEQKAKPFRKLIANEHDELFKYLLKDGLLLSVFTLCGVRARWLLEPSPDGLEQGEFWLSEDEYEKFGLKRSQKGQIRRRLKKLIGLKIIQKTEKKTGNKNAAVYLFVSKKVIDPNFQSESKRESEERTDGERAEINNNDKSVKNAIDNRDSENLDLSSSTACKERFDRIRRETPWLKKN